MSEGSPYSHQFSCVDLVGGALDPGVQACLCVCVRVVETCTTAGFGALGCFDFDDTAICVSNGFPVVEEGRRVLVQPWGLKRCGVGPLGVPALVGCGSVV